MDRANILIVGGGVVGCAVACALSRRWEDIFLAEQNPKVGMATSTRNSGVIHSGLYYPKDSLKARLCVAGNRLTYEFCAKHNVPHRRTGKLIVATSPEEAAKLEELAAHGRANGVEGIRPLDAAGIRAREPHVRGVAALEIPSTGILSSEDLVKTYARVAAEQGAHIVTRAKVAVLEPHADFIRATLRVGEDPGSSEETIEARCVINAAGLFSDEVAALLGNTRYRIYPVRGEYCEIRGPRAALINNLVYPLPHAEGLSLGVHFTKTLWGTVLVGPTARYVQDKNDYERDRLTAADFARNAQKMLPEVTEGDLQLAYSGLRPKLIPPGGKGYGDFVIARDPAAPRAIQLIGIESPGLTAAPSIAERVFQLCEEILQ
ncbi:MAG TPA: NAD(P)/FAD-dependent oxidoreductase [Candidatus Acidoferrales bacterium]|nr:NAD(P)/FAD-dependent oxidoreductase [Candidatus Acidoferrales bacterium]